MKVTDYNHYVKVHHLSIYRFVSKLIGDVDEAKDIVQETFVRLWEHGGQLEIDKIRPWLFTTSRRLCLSWLKERDRLGEIDESDVLESTIGINAYFDVNEIILKSLVLLSELQKSVLMLRDYEGYSYSEISHILNISEDSVKVHLFRARRKIRDHIKDLNLVI